MTLQKIDEEIAMAKKKIEELQKKIHGLEAKKIEEENLKIVRLVKAVNMDNRQLRVFLKAYAKGDIVLPEKYVDELKEDKND